MNKDLLDKYFRKLPRETIDKIQSELKSGKHEIVNTINSYIIDEFSIDPMNSITLIKSKVNDILNSETRIKKFKKFRDGFKKS